MSTLPSFKKSLTFKSSLLLSSLFVISTSGFSLSEFDIEIMSMEKAPTHVNTPTQIVATTSPFEEAKENQGKSSSGSQAKPEQLPLPPDSHKSPKGSFRPHKNKAEEKAPTVAETASVTSPQTSLKFEEVDKHKVEEKTPTVAETALGTPLASSTPTEVNKEGQKLLDALESLAKGNQHFPAIKEQLHSFAQSISYANNIEHLNAKELKTHLREVENKKSELKGLEYQALAELEKLKTDLKLYDEENERTYNQNELNLKTFLELQDAAVLEDFNNKLENLKKEFSLEKDKNKQNYTQHLKDKLRIREEARLKLERIEDDYVKEFRDFFGYAEGNKTILDQEISLVKGAMKNKPSADESVLEEIDEHAKQTAHNEELTFKERVKNLQSKVVNTTSALAHEAWDSVKKVAQNVTGEVPLVEHVIHIAKNLTGEAKEFSNTASKVISSDTQDNTNNDQDNNSNLENTPIRNKEVKEESSIEDL